LHHRLQVAPSDSTPDLAAIGTHVYMLAMLYIELAIIIVLILINGLCPRGRDRRKDGAAN